MLKNYVLIAWRSLKKNGFYTIINVFGLALGLLSCLLIGVYVLHELSYDRFHARADRIVRVTMEFSIAGTVNSTATTGTKVGPQFARSFPAVEDYARVFLSHNIVRANDKSFDEPRILYADPDFFRIFSFPLSGANPSTVLDASDKAVITRSMAGKYFGGMDPLGKILISGGKTLRVAAVCDDPPPNSQIHFDFVMPFLNLGNSVAGETWWTANWFTYLLLRTDRSAGLLQQQINAYMNQAEVRKEAGLEGKDYLAYHLEPLKRVHLYSALEGMEPNGSITYVYLFSLIALLILLIACANYSNLATAQSLARSGEIGMRKVMGASRRQVFFQFMGESVLTSFLAAIIALVAASLLIPYFSFITGRPFRAEDLIKPAPLAGLAGCCLLASLFAGIYPALILSGMRIMQVLRKGFHFTGGRGAFRQGLIILQFGISVFLIIYTIVILQQMRFIQTRDLGFNKDEVLDLAIGGNMLNYFQGLKDGFSRVPGVASVTAAYDLPDFIQWTDGIRVTDEKGPRVISLNAQPVDLDFVRTMQIKLISGRDFSTGDLKRMEVTDSQGKYYQPYLINETLARRIGWTPEQALGRIVEKNVPGPVVGVVRDFNFNSLHDPINPLLIFLGRGYSRHFLLRIRGQDKAGTIARLQASWKERLADRPFSYRFLDEDYNTLYLAEQRSSALFGIAAGMAILLACLGLFGLAAYTTAQRTKEIGIRRVLGAGAAHILMLVARQFLQLVALAILLAAPLAWWAGNHWLDGFAFRVPIPAYIFVGTAGLTLGLVWATVSFHALRAALSNPVKSLRSE
jgi:putative ABC transport system permease protein